jgi:hypothetical protein
MRSLLEKAIVHLLNEDNDAAVSLFHQFMVERARQIHNSLRQGDEVVLSEGWDDELGKEEYFADGDLDDLEGTDGDMSPLGGEADVDDVEGDMGGDEIEGEESFDGDMDSEIEGQADEGDTAERLGDIEDQLEELTREFEAMMAEIDGTEEGEGDDLGDLDMGDESEGDGDLDMGDESEDGTEMEPEAEDAMVGEAAEMDEEELDDITESVIAELEKVMVGDMQTDGEEVGAGGGKIKNGNDKSTLPTKKADTKDANPKNLMSKQSEHNSFERETPAVTPKKVGLKSRQTTNDTTGKAGAMKSVPKNGDAGALLNKDFAGMGKKNPKSVID